MTQDKKLTPYIASVTAFNQDESVNYDYTRIQFRRIIQKGGFIFCCGTNGDFSGLLEDEKLKIVEIAVDEGGSNAIANAGCPSTYATIKTANQFADLGINSVAVITPYFISCSQEGLLRHYMDVADAVNCPVYLYNIPARTGNSLERETVASLAQHPNILGIKDSSGDADVLNGFFQVKIDNPDFKVLSGSDAQILEGLNKGSSGCVSGLGNVVPDWVIGICKAYSAGDMDKAKVLQTKLTDFRTDLYKLGYAPSLVKRALYVMDPTVGNNRSPSLIPSSELDKKISEILIKYGVNYS